MADVGTQPLISILMTAYNRMEFIAEAIESVLSSTYTNFELIILDDCSTDVTIDIARSFEQQDRRIKVYKNDKNLGDYPNRNKAAGYAKGDFIMYVDSDDTLCESGLENCIKAMQSYNNESFGMYDTLGRKETYKMNSVEALRTHLLKQPFLTVGPGGTIIKRDFFKSINGYPEKYGPANDMYFNLKACGNTGIVMMPFDFMNYRRHHGQEINNHFNYLYNNYVYFNDALNELDLPVTQKELSWLKKKNKRRFVVNIIKNLVEKGNIKTTKEAIKKADFSVYDAFQGIFH